MTGEGKVVFADGNIATVEIKRPSACGHECTNCGACSTACHMVQVLNPIGAKAGDRVLIESDTKRVLAVSFALYIFPLILLIVSALLCEHYSLGLYSAMVYVPFAIIWIAAIKLLNKKLKLNDSISEVLKD